MSNICVIGTGYVGLVAIASFAELGHTVTGLDNDEGKIAAIQAGKIPFHEPGVGELLAKPENRERVRFTSSYADAVPGQDFIFICVNTPPTKKGVPRMYQVSAAARGVALHADTRTVIVNKSTGPVGMVDFISAIISEHRENHEAPAVVANPEFLNQGRALQDFLRPYQIVIGASDLAAGEKVRRLYEPLDAPISMVGPRAAEMTKLVSNAFRAMKVSFTNEVSSICERLEVDVTQVMGLLSADKAIGPWFMAAGAGWGGNCLPKDVATLDHVARANGVRPHMLHAAKTVNLGQRQSLFAKAERLLGGVSGKRIGVLGLAFKGGTDDTRESPAIAVVRKLTEAGAHVTAHDPMAIPNARRLLGDRLAYADDPYAVATGADLLMLLTEWPEYKELDLQRLEAAMAEANLIDGRNLFDEGKAKAAGFTYVGVGRGYPHARTGWRDGTAEQDGVVLKSMVAEGVRL
ncbi:MAG: UDP-glucose/GDP-mannose dehydrogenase family protein [Dehalococcoidia bacterium]